MVSSHPLPPTLNSPIRVTHGVSFNSIGETPADAVRLCCNSRGCMWTGTGAGAREEAESLHSWPPCGAQATAIRGEALPVPWLVNPSIWVPPISKTSHPPQQNTAQPHFTPSFLTLPCFLCAANYHARLISAFVSCHRTIENKRNHG